jgi:hypothetical protein
LPQVLAVVPPSTRHLPTDLDHENVSELRKIARTWLERGESSLPRDALIAALRKAMEDDQAAARVLRSLSKDERAVVAVYCRYGGMADGELIRIDLLDRGLLEVVEKRYSEHYTSREWKSNPIRSLADRWILRRDTSRRDDYWSSGYLQSPGQPFPRYRLPAGIVRQTEPAGPPRWSIPPAESAPHAVTRRLPAEVALDLSRVFAFVTARGSIKIRKDGSLATPTLRAMEKSVPLHEDRAFLVPEVHALLCELLRYGGALLFDENTARADPAAATRLFTQPAAWQAHIWARGWLSARNWCDGMGTPESHDLTESGNRAMSGRHVLAWALGCLARAGDHWYDLHSFISGLHALQRNSSFLLPYGTVAWDPMFPEAKTTQKSDPAEARIAHWFGHQGAWYANALMVSLVALGLVERGRLGRSASAPHGFHLTDLGRAVFGAPELPLPPEQPGQRFLIIQPNFDVLAYLDQADAPSAGFLGQIAESDSAASGPIQTFRITQTSVYQAQESGLSQAQIVEFFEQHSQRPPPANVLQTIADWSGKRESLTVRWGVTLLGFASTTDRDAYLEDNPGTACGERFVLAPAPGKKKLAIATPLVTNHLLGGRRTWVLDEEGHIGTTEPRDIVQTAYLRRIARPTRMGWQITAETIRQAAAAGMKPPLIHRWLEDHLARPAPSLIVHAIDAWLGKEGSVELADALLLHVPDEGQFFALRSSQRLKPFLLDSPGKHWILVEPRARKELAALLKELGFRVGRELPSQRSTATGAGGEV